VPRSVSFCPGLSDSAISTNLHREGTLFYPHIATCNGHYQTEVFPLYFKHHNSTSLPSIIPSLVLPNAFVIQEVSQVVRLPPCYSFLACHAAKVDVRSPTFRKNISFPSSRIKQTNKNAVNRGQVFV
jgi:hypothetical protein